MYKWITDDWMNRMHILNPMWPLFQKYETKEEAFAAFQGSSDFEWHGPIGHKPKQPGCIIIRDI